MRKNAQRPTVEGVFLFRHEVCRCGYCRCVHDGGYGAYDRKKCVRYTWPGPGADLPDDHKPTQKYKPRRRRVPSKRRASARESKSP